MEIIYSKKELLAKINDFITDLEAIKKSKLRYTKGDYETKAQYAVETVRDEIENVLYDFMYY